MAIKIIREGRVQRRDAKMPEVSLSLFPRAVIVWLGQDVKE